MEHNAEKGSIGLFIITGSIAFFILMHLQSFDLSWGESAILTKSSVLLGGAHPSGYPLQMILMHPARFLPIGDLIFRSNLFGLFMNALAIGTFAVLLQRLLKGPWAYSIIGAILLMCSLPFQTACRSIEVYSLNLLLIFGVLIFFGDTREPRKFMLGALIAGLTSAHHLTSVFILLPLFGGALLTRSISWGVRLLASCLFILGMSTELFLILRDTVNPELTWGDARSWTGFIDLVTASEESSGSFRAGLSAMETVLSRTVRSIRPTFQTVGYSGMILAVLGCLSLLKSERKMTVMMSISTVFFILGVSIYETRESTSFLLPVTTFVIIAMLAALNRIDHVCRGLLSGFLLIRVILIVFLVLRVLQSLLASLPDSAQEDRFPRLLISHMLDVAPNESIIMTRRSDVYFLGSYLMHCEMRHNDSKQMVFQHLLSFRWYLEDLNRVGIQSLSDDSWTQIPKDTHEWNAAISDLIVRRNGRGHDFLVTDFDTIRDMESVRGKSITLIPRSLFGLIPAININSISLSMPEVVFHLTAASRSNLGFQLYQAMQFNHHAGQLEHAERYREITQRLWTTKSDQ